MKWLENIKNYLAKKLIDRKKISVEWGNLGSLWSFAIKYDGEVVSRVRGQYDGIKNRIIWDSPTPQKESERK